MASELSGQTLVRQEPTTIWNRMFITLFFTNMVFNMGQNMSNSLLSIYANSLGASASAIGLVGGTFAISSILFRLISAPVMDTYNRKVIVVFAALTLSGAFWGFSMSGSLTALMGFRLMQGAGMAFGNACCLAMVSEMIPKDKYKSGIGYYSLAQAIAQATGPSTGLWLVDRMGYRTTYSVTACLMILAAVLASRIRVNYQRTRALKITFNNVLAKEAALPAAVMLLTITGTSAVNSFLVLYARGQGLGANIGLYFTVSAGAMLVLRPVIGKLGDRFGLVRVMIPALSCQIVAFYIISISTTLPGFLLAALVSSISSSACMPSMQALSMMSASPQRRGAVSSTNYIGMDLGMMLGPIIAGNVVQAVGFVYMYRIMVIPFIIAISIIFGFRNMIGRIEEDFAPGKAES